MTIFSNYSSLTLQFLQIKKQQKKSAAHITFPYTCVCSVFSPEPLQTDKGRGKQEVCSQEYFVTLYQEGPRKDQSALPNHKANTSDFNQHKESSRSMFMAKNFCQSQHCFIHLGFQVLFLHIMRKA